MQYEFIGQQTGKVYAVGNKNDCMRQLLKEFPSTYESKSGPRIIKNVYPEPIIIRPARKSVFLERG